jgi:hypothetical protein
MINKGYGIVFYKPLPSEMIKWKINNKENKIK